MSICLQCFQLVQVLRESLMIKISLIVIWITWQNDCKQYTKQIFFHRFEIHIVLFSYVSLLFLWEIIPVAFFLYTAQNCKGQWPEVQFAIIILTTNLCNKTKQNKKTNITFRYAFITWNKNIWATKPV